MKTSSYANHLVLPIGGLCFALATVGTIAYLVYEKMGPEIKHIVEVWPL